MYGTFLSFNKSSGQVPCNSYTMAVMDFADIYNRTPRAAGLRGKGVYISKITTQSWYK